MNPAGQRHITVSADRRSWMLQPLDGGICRWPPLVLAVQPTILDNAVTGHRHSTRPVGRGGPDSNGRSTEGRLTLGEERFPLPKFDAGGRFEDVAWVVMVVGVSSMTA